MRAHITGDSFVEGVAATGNNGWAQLIADALRPGVTSITGVGGSTSADLASRLAGELGPDIDRLVVSVGINDARYRPSTGANEVPLEAYQTNINHLIEIGERSNIAKIFLIGLTRVDETRTTPFKADKLYHNDAIAEYDATLAAIAAQHRTVQYISMPRLNDVSGRLADGLHPSDEGHHVLADVILRTLKSSDADENRS